MLWLVHKPQHLLPYGILVLFLFAEAAFCTKPSPCHNPASPCVLDNNGVSALGHLCVRTPVLSCVCQWVPVTVTVSVQFFLFLCLTSTLSNYRVLQRLVFCKLRVQFPQVWHLFLSQIHLCCLLFFNRHQVTPTVLFFSVSTHLPLSPRYYSKCVQYVFLYHVLDFPANTILKLVLKRLHFNFCPGLHKTDVEQQTVVMWLTELKGNSFLCDWML